MDVGAIMDMVEDEFHHCCLIIDVIVSNGESKMRDVLKYLLIVSRGQVLKSSKGKLDEEIPAPSFLADPSHCVKVVSKHNFSIVNDGKSQRCGYTEANVLRFKKYWGYTINKNRKKV